MKNLRVQLALLSLIIATLTVAVVSRITANLYPSAATPIDFEATLFTQEKWMEIGRERAVAHGLDLATAREETALMPFASYLLLSEQPLYDSRLSRNHPVFVYQAIGIVPELQGFGSATGRADIGGFIFVFDAVTGFMIGSTALADLTTALDMSFIPAHEGFDAPLSFPFPTPIMSGEDTGEWLPLPPPLSAD